MDTLTTIWWYLDGFHLGLIAAVLLLTWFYFDKNKQIEYLHKKDTDEHNRWKAHFAKEYMEALTRNTEYVDVLFVGNNSITDNQLAAKKVEEELARKGYDMNKVLVLPYYVEYRGKSNEQGNIVGKINLPKVNKEST